jgi:hypothetical protein
MQSTISPAESLPVVAEGTEYDPGEAISSVQEWHDAMALASCSPKSIFLRMIDNFDGTADDEGWSANIHYGVASNCPEFMNDPVIGSAIACLPSMTVTNVTRDELDKYRDAWAEAEEDFPINVLKHNSKVSIYYVTDDRAWERLTDNANITVHVPAKPAEAAPSRIVASQQDFFGEDHERSVNVISATQDSMVSTNKKSQSSESGGNNDVHSAKQQETSAVESQTSHQYKSGHEEARL